MHGQFCRPTILSPCLFAIELWFLGSRPPSFPPYPDDRISILRQQWLAVVESGTVRLLPLLQVSPTTNVFVDGCTHCGGVGANSHEHFRGSQAEITFRNWAVPTCPAVMPCFPTFSGWRFTTSTLFITVSKGAPSSTCPTRCRCPFPRTLCSPPPPACF